MIKPQHDTIQYLNRKSFSELNYEDTDKLVNRVSRDLEVFKVKVIRAAKRALNRNAERTSNEKDKTKETGYKQDLSSLYKDGVPLYNDTGR